MSDPSRFERRVVRSADPSLSAEANGRLTDELRTIVGADAVDVPAARADPAHAAHGGLPAVVADIVGARIGAVFTALTAICVLAVAALAWDSVAVLVAALAVLVVATVLAARAMFGLMDEVEHPDPETAALLEDEGVGDPDRLMQDLVDEFRPDPAEDRDRR